MGCAMFVAKLQSCDQEKLAAILQSVSLCNPIFSENGSVHVQWRQQLDIFSNALQTGQLDVQAFGLEFLVRSFSSLCCCAAAKQIWQACC